MIAKMKKLTFLVYHKEYDAGEIAKFIREVRPVIYGGRVIDAEQMKVYIDKMNEIIDHI